MVGLAVAVANIDAVIALIRAAPDATTARAQLMGDIRAHLEAGKTVVADRFFLSTYAYQITGRALPADLIRSANQLAVAGFKPDLTLVLNFPVHAGLDRKVKGGDGPDRIERASAAFHESVAGAFQDFLDPCASGVRPGDRRRRDRY